MRNIVVVPFVLLLSSVVWAGDPVIHSIEPLLHVQSDKELHDAQSATL